MFNEILGIEEFDNKYKINKRIAVRGIIIRDEKILMIKTSKGDYKLPGGGVNPSEDYISALKREVCEETGYLVKSVGSFLGTILERGLDDFEADHYFEMTSNYYLVEISDVYVGQNLDEYEKNENFKANWVSISEALETNKKIIKENRNINSWVEREIISLKLIKERMNI
ncbi:MAG: NUDIX domain-containing protein [Clostridiales bacterium]|nr:NUDIX domain-containing protein [Clostridiales bacterium]